MRKVILATALCLAWTATAWACEPVSSAVSAYTVRFVVCIALGAGIFLDVLLVFIGVRALVRTVRRRR